MSTDGRARGGGGGRQFPVGRLRHVHVPVVDAGCGCRPRRPRLLHLPSFSFLSRPCQQLGVSIKQQYQAAAARGEQYSCASTSTASFSSSSAATRSSTTGYSSDYYYCYPTTTKQQQQPPPSPPLANKQAAASPAPGKRQQLKGGRKKTKKRQHEKQAAGGAGLPAEEGVGVAVEKESSDPRADFRDSMVQMVVEMGLCDWDGLRGMLRRLLALNAPRHHAAILTAFAEVCTQLAGAAAAAAPPASPQPSPPAYYGQYRR